MKTNFKLHSHRHIATRFALLCIIWLLCGRVAAAAVTFTVNPTIVSNDYSGLLTVRASGLLTFENVQVDVYVDANANGTVDGADLLVQSFSLTDGGASVIGGVTNINIPADLDSAPGSITASLNFRSLGLVQRIVGQYVYRLSSPTSRFTPVPALFNVTNSAYSQSVSGIVRSGGMALANPGVLLLTAESNKEEGLGEPVAGALANSSGAFTIKAPPGNYMLLAFKSNYVADFSTPLIVTLGSGATISTNLNLLASSRTISGKVIDSNNSNLTLPGVMVAWMSPERHFALGFTDAAGKFTVPVTPGQWSAGGDSEPLRLRGYIEPDSGPPVDTTGGNVTGFNIELPKVSALFYGTIIDNQNRPIANANINGYQSNDSGPYNAGALSDSNGYYVMAVVAGIWGGDVDAIYSGLADYIFSAGPHGIVITNGQAIRYDFVARHATNLITGFVKDNQNRPIEAVNVYGFARLDGIDYYNGNRTDSNGYYSLNVAGGTWTVGVNCSEGNDSLTSKGYGCVDSQTVTITNNNRTANFSAQPCGPVQILSASPDGGEVGWPYFFALQASGCNQPFNWSLESGSDSLPPGLTLESDGIVSGNPSTAGSFSFTVRVSDNTGASASRFLVINIIANKPLQIITRSLPNGTAGTAYVAQLEASGGTPPYYWSLALGSANLPPGLTLAIDGNICGTPTTSGTFNFISEVSDSVMTTVSQVISLSIASELITPVFQPVVRAGTLISLTWTSTAGSTYQVQVKNNLNDTVWSNLTNVTATGSTTSFTDSLSSISQRYYRLKVQ